MKAESLNAKDLFEKNVRYVIPTFQRPYVWNKADQWEPLWEDVEHAAEKYLDALDQVGEDELAKAEEIAGRHFLGAIVVQQELTGSSEIETRTVIDGQQRLTTIQLLLDAAQAVAEEQGWTEVAEGLTDLVLNNKRYARRDPDHIFKLWPTSTDRPAFRAAMRNGADTRPFATSRILQAHDYFRLRIAEWVRKAVDDADRARRVHALETALLGLIELVVIDLGANDDAFVIFETLNARGTPLLASDLVKNYVMQTTAAAGNDPDELHAEFWIQFEKDTWWREEVRQGRLTRPRLDMFLDHWLELRQHEDVASHDVFPNFRRYVEDGHRHIRDVVADMQLVGAKYREIEEIDPWSPEGTFLYRWRTIDAGTSTPVLLWLFSQPASALSGAERLACLRVLESFLVRRMIGRLTTKDYNKFFLDVLKRLDEAGPASARRTLIDYLNEQASESRQWPSDAEFRAALIDLPLYRLLTRSRLRFVLEALEDHMRTTKSEDQHVPRGKLTIEHILPQAWPEHWPFGAPTADEGTGAQRDRVLHTIGNLTLVTWSLNPAMSNAGWTQKRKALSEHTTLRLNARLLNRWSDRWSEDTIAERAADLADMAIAIWPRTGPETTIGLIGVQTSAST